MQTKGLFGFCSKMVIKEGKSRYSPGAVLMPINDPVQLSNNDSYSCVFVGHKLSHATLEEPDYLCNLNAISNDKDTTKNQLKSDIAHLLFV